MAAERRIVQRAGKQPLLAPRRVVEKQSYAHLSPILIAYYNITGSRGRSGAAEKWSRRKGCPPHFMDQCLLNVDWVGFLLLV